MDKNQKINDQATAQAVDLNTQVREIEDDIVEMWKCAYRAGQSNNGMGFDPFGGHIHNDAVEKRKSLIIKIRKLIIP